MKSFMQTSRKKRKVLVVDDELINRELLEVVLSQTYDVSCASNGKEAIEMLKSASEPYSLILLDILMPEKSGLQTLEDCKADDELKDIPVIVMTSEKSAEARSIRMGAADFISKPYRMPEVIIARCERVIELAEEKELIRSIETDPATGLYIKVFFMAYVRRLLSHIKSATDAVVLRLESGEADDYTLHKTARIVEKILLQNEGIACRAENGTFFAYCLHNDDYDSLLQRMREELSADVGTANVSLRMGVCPNISEAKPVESWFESAENNCLS